MIVTGWSLCLFVEKQLFSRLWRPADLVIFEDKPGRRKDKPHDGNPSTAMAACSFSTRALLTKMTECRSTHLSERCCLTILPKSCHKEAISDVGKCCDVTPLVLHGSLSTLSSPRQRGNKNICIISSGDSAVKIYK